MNHSLMSSVKINKDINKKLLHQVIDNGYGMRGKSKWIIEAIESFLLLDDYPELVDIATTMDNLDEVISIRVSDALLKQLDEAVIVVRRKYPAMEGVKSNIVRASILQRLIRA